MRVDADGRGAGSHVKEAGPPEQQVIHLPGLPDIFTDEIYDVKESSKGNGTKTTVVSINKMKLCNKVCKNANAEDFINFSPILDFLELLVK